MCNFHEVAFSPSKQGRNGVSFSFQDHGGDELEGRLAPIMFVWAEMHMSQILVHHRSQIASR